MEGTSPSAEKSRLVHRFLLAEKTAKDLDLEAARLLVEWQTRLYTKMLWDSPEQIVWTNMVMPTELFYACGLAPVHAEMTAGWISSLLLSKEYIRVAEERGFHVGLCSYHKAVIGALECGAIPPPRLAVFSSHICDGGNGLLQYFRQRFRTPIFLLDIPYQQQGERAVRFVEGQLRDLIRFLKAYTGKTLYPKALSNAVRYSNHSRCWQQAVNELRKGPALFYGNQALRNLFGLSFLSGSSRGEMAAEAYYRQIKERSARPETWLSTDKPPRRILWIHFAPLHAGDVMRYFEKTLGCLIAFDILGYVYWPTLSEEDPIRDLAKKVLSHFFLTGSGQRMSLYRRLIEDYRINGAVFFMHQGCRAIPGASWELRMIAEEKKIPFLELPGDCIDPRGFSSEQVMLRMEAFRESMDLHTNRKGEKDVLGD